MEQEIQNSRSTRSEEEGIKTEMEKEETANITDRFRVEEIISHLIKGESSRQFMDELTAKWDISPATFYRRLAIAKKAIKSGDYKQQYLMKASIREEADSEKEKKLKSALDIKVLLHSFLDGAYKEEILMSTNEGVKTIERKPSSANVLRAIRMIQREEKESIENENNQNAGEKVTRRIIPVKVSNNNQNAA
jgi:hypothetical protein